MNPNRTRHIVGITVGALLLVVSPVVARLLYVSGMQRATDTINTGMRGIPDPARLSGDIDSVLYACAGGLAGSVIGLVILIVSVVLFVRAGRRFATSHAVTNATGGT